MEEGLCRDFIEGQRPSTSKVIGIGIVLLLHVVLIYALVTGLATSAVDLIKKSLKIKIIQVSPPPPQQVWAPSSFHLQDFSKASATFW